MSEVWRALAGASGDGNRSRIARYGWDYGSDKWIGDTPLWLHAFQEPGALLDRFDSVTINEYPPGKGIGMHVDNPKFDRVQILTLNSGAEMDFIPNKDARGIHDDRLGDFSLYLAPRSLLVLEGFALGYKHGIAEKKSDIVDGREIVRQTRYSIVFRQKKP